MGFRYKLIHHPQASADYNDTLNYFREVDEGLMDIFKDDFQAVLRGLATGRFGGTLYAQGHSVKWVKLRRFSHKIFFENEGAETCMVLAIISGKRHPNLIRQLIDGRGKSDVPSED